jgi:hypothetical protein
MRVPPAMFWRQTPAYFFAGFQCDPANVAMSEKLETFRLFSPGLP